MWLAPSEDVSDIRRFVRWEARFYFRDVDVLDIEVCANWAAFERRESLELDYEVRNIRSTESDPIILWVHEVRAQLPKPVELYNGRDFLTATKEYLGEILERFLYFYEFPKRESSHSQVTLDDVLNARNGVEGVDWKFARSTRNMRVQKFAGGPLIAVKKREQLTHRKLPQAYRFHEYWGCVAKMNDFAQGRQDASLITRDDLGDLEFIACFKFWDTVKI